MIVLLLGSSVAVVLGGLMFGLFFMRSSKNLPETFSQLWAEILWQIFGFVALVEDHLLRYKNHTGELTFEP